MGEIVPIRGLVKIIRNFKKQGKIIVLAGGCFDVLHPGHVVFLEKAKKTGDILIILLESDEKVRELKGANRPVYSQRGRAKVLSALYFVDCVVMLPYFSKDREYDELIVDIKPDVIAATFKDKNNVHFQRSAKLAGAKLKFVVGMVGKYSTSRILGR